MFFDIHAHVSKYPFPSGGLTIFPTAGELSAMHEEYDISGAAVLPIVSPEVYVPQSVGEVIDACRESGDRWVPFMNIDPRAVSNSSDAPLGELIEFFLKQGCVGVGEVLMNMEWRDPKLQNLMRHVESFGLPLTFDMTGRLDGHYGIYDEPGMPQFERCLEKFPNLIFLGHGPAFWAEISTLRDPADRVGYPDYPVLAEGRVPELMREYPNLMLDLSAGSGANALMRDEEYAVKFLNEFYDRALFGTDICYAGQRAPLPGFLLKLRDEGKLSERKFNMIARENALRLLKIERSAQIRGK